MRSPREDFSPRVAARRRFVDSRSVAGRYPRPATSGGRHGRPSSCPVEAAARIAPQKSVIMVYLQGGPSHLDLWDPKDNVPDNVRSVFKPIATKLPGVQFTELLPKLAQMNDKFTMIRSMSYTPNGLFNHTAAIYQMHDRLHDRQGEPRRASLNRRARKTSRTSARNIVRLQAADRADAAVRHAAAPAAGEQRRRQRWHGRLPGQGATILTTLYPAGDDLDMAQDGAHQGRRPRSSARSPASRLERRAQPARPDQPRHADARQGRRELRSRRDTTTRPEPDRFRAGLARPSTCSKSPMPCVRRMARTRSAKVACSRAG